MYKHDCIDTMPSADWKSWAAEGLHLLASDLIRLLDILKLWQQRSTMRRRLGEMDGRLLRDAGLDGIEARREAGKPFWRA